MMKTRRARLVSNLFTLAATATLCLLALPRAALAFEPESPGCFSTAPTWNAPAGTLVSGISPGPIAAVITGVGESRTHVMISNGDWATQSTTRQPSIRTSSVYTGICPVCVKVGEIPDTGMPLRPTELAAGSPGFSQINMGGAYAYWSTASQVWRQVSVPTTGAEILDPTLCGNRCKVRASADWLWSSAPYTTVPAGPGSNTFYYSLGFNSLAGDFYHISYGVHQYMDGVFRVQLGMGGEHETMRGLACSQVPAYAYRNWFVANSPKIPAGTNSISVHYYGHNETVNAGVALWYSVYNSCKGTDVGFWGKMANSLISIGTGSNLQDTTCNHAAWQVLNCFFQGEDPNGGGCKSISSTPWNTYAPDGTKQGAKTLSPDDLMGLSGRPTTRPDAGPWANWTQGALQWNGGGSTYGCFY